MPAQSGVFTSNSSETHLFELGGRPVARWVGRFLIIPGGGAITAPRASLEV